MANMLYKIWLMSYLGVRRKKECPTKGSDVVVEQLASCKLSTDMQPNTGTSLMKDKSIKISHKLMLGF